ncbi:pigment precursor permease [Artemisia annua]|uniref:Pigment permease n=1 Tax=Artemisia annua TaxID=35608 RepID=A0A2U1KRP6_ARTAN|nr:pigment precursor permease [Artemisia annua]
MGTNFDIKVWGLIVVIQMCDILDSKRSWVAQAIYYAIILIGIKNLKTVQPVFATDLTVFYRESAAGMYSSLPYATGHSLSTHVIEEIPYASGHYFTKTRYRLLKSQVSTGNHGHAKCHFCKGRRPFSYYVVTKCNKLLAWNLSSINFPFVSLSFGNIVSPCNTITTKCWSDAGTNKLGKTNARGTHRLNSLANQEVVDNNNNDMMHKTPFYFGLFPPKSLGHFWPDFPAYFGELLSLISVKQEEEIQFSCITETCCFKKPVPWLGDMWVAAIVVCRLWGIYAYSDLRLILIAFKQSAHQFCRETQKQSAVVLIAIYFTGFVKPFEVFAAKPVETKKRLILCKLIQLSTTKRAYVLEIRRVFPQSRYFLKVPNCIDKLAQIDFRGTVHINKAEHYGKQNMDGRSDLVIGRASTGDTSAALSHFLA